MKTRNLIFLKLIVSVLFLFRCQPEQKDQLDMDNYYAWCIVPFDSMNRTPMQRISMLKELGFESYAYDWRKRHLDEMAHELKLAEENDIDIYAIWMWINGKDSVGALSAENERILQIIEDTGTRTQLWIGVSEDWFEGLSADSSLLKAIYLVDYISLRAEELKCSVGLYNHGGWFGDPENQVQIIKSLPGRKIGIIYNFHHAHEHLKEYPDLVELMLPYLWAVNLNGMREEGPKILPIGEGDFEDTMIDILDCNGFDGPYGILGHVEDADVKVVLQRNLTGLRDMLF
jgi:hypothetical protein